MQKTYKHSFLDKTEQCMTNPDLCKNLTNIAEGRRQVRGKE